jgi:hypothetical protein
VPQDTTSYTRKTRTEERRTTTAGLVSLAQQFVSSHPTKLRAALRRAAPATQKQTCCLVAATCHFLI